MNNFSYAKATDVRGAVSELDNNSNAKFLAGGTNLLDLMKIDIMTPERLVDIKKLPLQTIEKHGGGLRLGALVTNADTAYNEQVKQHYPLLSKAILAGASAQLRNMATDGGNLLQRTRCYYFYDKATPCNKREPGTGCSAINGFNRIHAILGHSEHCIATHPSDMAAALAALEATINVTGTEGERTIKISDFHRLPGDTPHIDSNLKTGELITSIDLPAKGFADHHMYLKIRDRNSYAFAIVSVAAALELDGDVVKDARIALGGVAHKPWRDAEAEHSLKNKPATQENFRAAAELILKDAKGFAHNEFKIELAKRAIVRALEQAVKMEDAI
jgi:xanthine dehydrogenase YagS FAD-binding subunit